MRLPKFLNTAPKIRSGHVLQILRNGKGAILLDAVTDERKNHDSVVGRSKNGKVTVRRVGYSTPKVR